MWSSNAKANDVIDLVIAFALFTGGIYSGLIFVFPLAAVYQERKLWLDEGMVPLNLIGMFKVYLYNLIWFSGSFFGCVIALISKPLLSSTLDYHVNVFVERAIGKACQMILGPVEILGEDHLPDDDGKSLNNCVIYAANHSSQIDIGVSYYLNRRFKWISKRSVVYMPGVGMVMILGRHLLLDRKGKVSIKRMYEQATYWLDKKGRETCPIFIFPQGTRSMSKRLPFKDGAFNMAISSEVPIIPVSIAIPNNLWNNLYPFGPPEKVTITIHKPIPVCKETEKESLKKLCEDIVYSAVPSQKEQKKTK